MTCASLVFGLSIWRTICAFLLGPARTNSANPFANNVFIFRTPRRNVAESLRNREVSSHSPIGTLLVDLAAEMFESVGEVVALVVVIGQSHDVPASDVAKLPQLSHFYQYCFVRVPPPPATRL